MSGLPGPTGPPGPRGRSGEMGPAVSPTIHLLFHSSIYFVSPNSRSVEVVFSHEKTELSERN